MRDTESAKTDTLAAASAPTTTRRWLWRVIGGVLVIAVLGYLAVGAYVATQLTKPDRQPQRTAPAAFGLPFEDVSIQARDGLVLAGWFIPNNEAGRAIVLVHGRGSCRSCEFDGRFVEFAGRLQTAGFNILMIDLRAHGQSEGRNFTLGDHERRDVLGAVDWLQKRGLDKIGVLGVSLGAASSARAAANPVDGESIKALVLDSSFGDVREVLENEFSEQSGLPNAFLAGSILMGRLLLQADVGSVQPVNDLPRIRAPVMLIFGGQDDIVPVSQFHAMAAARPDAEAWLVEDAGHARIYNADPEEYVTRVSRFFAESLR